MHTTQQMLINVNDPGWEATTAVWTAVTSIWIPYYYWILITAWRIIIHWVLHTHNIAPLWPASSTWSPLRSNIPTIIIFMVFILVIPMWVIMSFFFSIPAFLLTLFFVFIIVLLPADIHRLYNYWRMGCVSSIWRGWLMMVHLHNTQTIIKHR